MSVPALQKPSPRSNQLAPTNLPVPVLTSISCLSGVCVVTNFIVSFELHDLHREPALLAALEIFEDRCKALDSVWLVCSPWSAEQIRAHLGRYIGADDSLVVEALPVNKGWSGWVGTDVREWLTTHLGPEN